MIVSFLKGLLHILPNDADLFIESFFLFFYKIFECEEARVGSANFKVLAALSAHDLLAKSIYIHLNYKMEKNNKVRNKKNVQPPSRISYITQLTSK